MFKIGLTLGLVGGSSWAWAAEPLSGVATNLSSSAVGVEDSLGRLLSGLLLVIGLIILLGWIVRRWHLLPRQEGQLIQLVASQSIGPRERVVLLQVGNQQILLGVSQGQITPLHVLNEALPIPVHPTPAPSEFARHLMEFMGRKDKDKT